MMMPGRSYSAQTGYRFGFNGKENDNEVKGEGNELDYGMRVYDTRLGRFLSVDPLTRNYPWYTPYQYAGNMPIWFIDIDGQEPKSPPRFWEKYLPLKNLSTGKISFEGSTQRSNDPLVITDYQAIYDHATKQYFFVSQDPATGEYFYWKHKDGADPMHLIYSRSNPKNDNGSWVVFTPTSEPNPADLLTAMTIGPLVTLPGALIYGEVAADAFLAKRIADKAEEQTQTNEKPPIENDPVKPEYDYGKYGSNFKDHAEEIREDLGIPKEWEVKPSDKDEGVRFIDPANPKANNVRVMPGRPGSQTEKPYVVQYKNGTPVNAKGEPVQSTTGSEQNKASEIHVPLENYKF